MRGTRIPLPVSWLATTYMAIVSAMPASLIFERQSSCAAANFEQCTDGAGFPSYFCCPQSQTCVALAGNTTLLCCPAGSSCAMIEPISCDITQQNGLTNPSALIKTTALNGELLHCGDGTCCPFGYSCNANNQCTENEDQSAAPSQSSAPVSSTPATAASSATQPVSTNSVIVGSTIAGATPTSSSSPATIGSATTNSAAAAAVSDTSSSSSKSSGGSSSSSSSSSSHAGVGIGIGVAVAVVAVIAAVVFFCRRRAAKRAGKGGRGGDHMPKLKRSTSSFGNIISNPIMPMNQPTFRSDFARKPSSSGSDTNGSWPAMSSVHSRSPVASRSSSRGSVNNNNNNSNGRGGGGGGGGPPRIPPIRGMRNSSTGYGFGGTDDNPAPFYGIASSIYPTTPGQGPGHGPLSPPIPTLPEIRFGSPGGGGGGGGFGESRYGNGNGNGSGNREPSTLSINVFADPRTVASGANNSNFNNHIDPTTTAGFNTGTGTGTGTGLGGGRQPVESRRYSVGTTFTSLMEQADLGSVARGAPFVPKSVYLAPSTKVAERRRK